MRSLKDARIIEPYQDDKGDLRFFIVTSKGKTENVRLKDLQDDNTVFPGDLEKLFDLQRHISWQLPVNLRPFKRTVSDLPDIHKRIVRYLGTYIWIPDTRAYDVLACWAILSYFREDFRFMPLIVVDGPSNAGKSSLMEAMSKICYRGNLLGNFSGALVPRIILKTGATICLDEFIDNISGDKRVEIMNIIKTVVSKNGTYGRAAPKTRDEYDIINIFTSMMISVKGSDLAEDVTNRGIRIQLLAKPKKEKTKNIGWVDRYEDGQETDPLSIQSDLLDLKIAQHVSDGDGNKHLYLSDRVAEVLDILEDEKDGMPTYGFKWGIDSTRPVSNRELDIASSMMPVALLCGVEDSVMEFILKQEENYREASFNSLEGQTFRAIVDCITELHESTCLGKSRIGSKELNELGRKITTRAIAERLNHNLAEEGNLEQGRQIATLTVTRFVKTLGLSYTMGRGAGQGATALNPSDKDFKSRFCRHIFTFDPESVEKFDTDELSR